MGQNQKKDSEITKEVDYFIQYFGMRRLLEEMIQNVQKAEKSEKEKKRNVKYLEKLSIDLQLALKNYEERYEKI